MPAHFTPERSTSPHLPRLMLRPTRARQLPSLELGNPPKLHPHPKSQLQNSYPCPLSVHCVFVAVAVAMAGPPVRVWSSTLPSNTAAVKLGLACKRGMRLRLYSKGFSVKWVLARRACGRPAYGLSSAHPWSR